jgi:hypothetical protein
MTAAGNSSDGPTVVMIFSISFALIGVAIEVDKLLVEMVFPGKTLSSPFRLLSGEFLGDDDLLPVGELLKKSMRLLTPDALNIDEAKLFVLLLLAEAKSSVSTGNVENDLFPKGSRESDRSEWVVLFAAVLAS